MFKSCLICTDFNDGLHRLIDFIPNLAAGGLKQIVFCHSVPLWEEGEVPRIDRERIDLATERLSPALQEIPDGVDVKIEVVSGRPIETVPRILEKYQIDVILVGTPVRSLLKEKIFGSTTMSLAKSTATPLLILRPQLISTYTVEEMRLRCQHLWRYLLIPYEDTQICNYALEKVKACARSQSGKTFQKCLVLWTVDDSTRDRIMIEQRSQQAEEKLKSVKAELEELGLEVETQVREGNFVNQILDAALNYDISAIAVASNYKTNLLNWVIPSDMEDILRSSWFPVLFFSPKN
ncbi:MAG: universal stress protein [Prochloraceae cyanobacterium]|nr:universal stress protein [Prochloraceae cyanobacterium]